MKRRFVLASCVLGGGLLIVCNPIFAHHGTAASFDNAHRMTVKGTVTEFVWSNPHCQLYLDVKNDMGEVVNWGIELLSPGNLVKIGQAGAGVLNQTVTNRTWTYSFTWDPDATIAAGTANVFAIGIDAQGDAVITTAIAVTTVP